VIRLEPGALHSGDDVERHDEGDERQPDGGQCQRPGASRLRGGGQRECDHSAACRCRQHRPARETSTLQPFRAASHWRDAEQQRPLEPQRRDRNGRDECRHDEGIAAELLLRQQRAEEKERDCPRDRREHAREDKEQAAAEIGLKRVLHPTRSASAHPAGGGDTGSMGTENAALAEVHA
jgi:hypothetical protein